MSGLFGYFGRIPATPVAHRMGAVMRHDERLGVEIVPTEPRGAIGRIGLGLLNQSPAPARASIGQVQLLLCGEFYHQEQRRTTLMQRGAVQPTASDCELALQVYLEEGCEGLTRLEGAFMIAVWDGRDNLLTLVNDRFGLYPHYYTRTDTLFSFAPEIKAITSVPGVQRRLDMVAVAEYTRFQQLLGERTWLEGITLLPPASILRYSPQNNTHTLIQYWDWDAIVPAPAMRFEEAVEETIRLFQRAIDAMTKPPLRVGVYLSGGLDGRTILGFINPTTSATAVTFGVANCRDVVYAADLARRAGRPHCWVPFTNGRWVLEYADQHLRLTEGQHSWMHAHGMSTLPKASSLIDVNLSGWDGGTTMGGRIDEYTTDAYYRHAPDEASFCQRLYEGFCRVFTWPGFNDSQAALLFGGTGHESLIGLARDSFAETLLRTAHYPTPYRADYFYLLQHVRRSTQNMIVFQRSAIEVRCPFFDYDLMSFLYSLPERYRASTDLHHAVITQRMPALALVPNEKTDQLPHSNALIRNAHRSLQRAKRGVNRVAGHVARPIFPTRPRLYADYETYLRTDLRSWAESILFDHRTTERGLFNPKVVRDLWQRHVQGNELWTIGTIAPLMAIEMTTRLLIDGEHS
jgi:asparagine synthase (glutamine-hydrolysing)